MNVRSLRSLALLLVVALAAPGFAAPDIKGSKDHPMIKRYEGSTIIQYHTKNYDRLLVPVSKTTFVNGAFGFPRSTTVEGQVTGIQYKAPVGRTSLEVFHNYQTALQYAGFKILFSCSRYDCGTGDTFAQTLFGITTPPLTLNSKSQNYLAAKLHQGGRDVWVRLFVIENEEWWSNAGTEKGQVVVQLDIAETKPMETGMVVVDAAGMRKAIQDDGRVALYGILFDSGLAEVKKESQEALDEIAKLLKIEPSLRLLVVGHTDNVGSMEANRELSEKRAKAVVYELVSKRGVGQQRLTWFGAGFAAPVATNRSPDGRAKNRRVELVEY